MALGIGRTVKRDAVLVKVTTDDGLVGWGEAHAGRSPGAIARIVETTLKALVAGMDAADVSGWASASTGCSLPATAWGPVRRWP